MAVIVTLSPASKIDTGVGPDLAGANIQFNSIGRKQTAGGQNHKTNTCIGTTYVGALRGSLLGGTKTLKAHIGDMLP